MANASFISVPAFARTLCGGPDSMQKAELADANSQLAAERQRLANLRTQLEVETASGRQQMLADKHQQDQDLNEKRKEQEAGLAAARSRQEADIAAGRSRLETDVAAETQRLLAWRRQLDADTHDLHCYAATLMTMVETAQRTAFELEQDHLNGRGSKSQAPHQGTCPLCHEHVTLLPTPQPVAAAPAAAPEAAIGNKATVQPSQEGTPGSALPLRAPKSSQPSDPSALQHPAAGSQPSAAHQPATTQAHVTDSSHAAASAATARLQAQSQNHEEQQHHQGLLSKARSALFGLFQPSSQSSSELSDAFCSQRCTDGAMADPVQIAADHKLEEPRRVRVLPRLRSQTSIAQAEATPNDSKPGNSEQGVSAAGQQPVSLEQPPTQQAAPPAHPSNAPGPASQRYQQQQQHESSRGNDSAWQPQSVPAPHRQQQQQQLTNESRASGANQQPEALRHDTKNSMDLSRATSSQHAAACQQARTSSSWHQSPKASINAQPADHAAFANPFLPQHVPATFPEQSQPASSQPGQCSHTEGQLAGQSLHQGSPDNDIEPKFGPQDSYAFRNDPLEPLFAAGAANGAGFRDSSAAPCSQAASAVADLPLAARCGNAPPGPATAPVTAAAAAVASGSERGNAGMASFAATAACRQEQLHMASAIGSHDKEFASDMPAAPTTSSHAEATHVEVPVPRTTHSQGEGEAGNSSTRLPDMRATVQNGVSKGVQGRKRANSRARRKRRELDAALAASPVGSARSDKAPLEGQVKQKKGPQPKSTKKKQQQREQQQQQQRLQRGSSAQASVSDKGHTPAKWQRHQEIPMQQPLSPAGLPKNDWHHAAAQPHDDCNHKSKKQKLGDDEKLPGQMQQAQAGPSSWGAIDGSAPAWNSQATGQQSLPWQSSHHIPWHLVKKQAQAINQAGMAAAGWGQHHPRPIHFGDAREVWRAQKDVAGPTRHGNVPWQGRPPGWMGMGMGVPPWGQGTSQHAPAAPKQQDQQGHAPTHQSQQPRGSSPPRRCGNKPGFVKRVTAARDTAGKSAQTDQAHLKSAAALLSTLADEAVPGPAGTSADSSMRAASRAQAAGAMPPEAARQRVATSTEQAARSRKARQPASQAAAINALKNDAPVLLEEMRQQNLLNTLQLLELDASASGSASEAASLDTSTQLYQQMHAILDKICEGQDGWNSGLGRRGAAFGDAGSGPAYEGQPGPAMPTSAARYCLDALRIMLEFTQTHEGSNSWGWSRQIQAFVFIFEEANRIVVEKPEYGFATYFFEIEDGLSIAAQVCRLLAVLSVKGVTRGHLIGDKSSLGMADRLSREDAAVLEACGWDPAEGIKRLLNFSDERIRHDNRAEPTPCSRRDYRTRILSQLQAGRLQGRFERQRAPVAPSNLEPASQ
ncbi:hypothetical protein WJX74_001053 [Apatococcus lobatus]|uniref:Uncharacterized protein n=1 Tax=Apatococcus lobatus TaxID=904363 RepID=A0AAW1S524_9CHLO